MTPQTRSTSKSRNVRKVTTKKGEEGKNLKRNNSTKKNDLNRMSSISKVINKTGVQNKIIGLQAQVYALKKKLKAIENSKGNGTKPNKGNNFKSKDVGISRSSDNSLKRSSGNLQLRAQSSEESMNVNDAKRIHSNGINLANSVKPRTLRKMRSREVVSLSRGQDEDFMDPEHKCTLRCPVGCQGHFRAREILIFESSRFFLKFDNGDGKRFQSSSIMDIFRQKENVVMPEKGSKVETNEKTRAPLSLPSLPIPEKVRLIIKRPPVAREEALRHAWNPMDCSFNLIIKPGDPFTVMRGPVAHSTDLVRSRMGYTSGLHVFRVVWPLGERGTHAVVGVATTSTSLHEVGYSSLVGSGLDSWGWDLSRNMAYHGQGNQGGKPYPSQRHNTWIVPRSFHLILDMENGTLSFETQGVFLGPAFTGLRECGQSLFPAISTVWGRCQVSLYYLGSWDSSTPPS